MPPLVQVTRPIWQYLKTRVEKFQLNPNFNRGGVFVATGEKSDQIATLSKQNGL